jgi:hypothetical protein
MAQGLADADGDPRNPGGASAEATSTLLGVTHQADVRVAVLLRVDGASRLMLALPATTLVQSQLGFEALDVLLEQGYEQAVAGLESLLGVAPASYAEIEWAELTKAAAAFEVDGDWPEDLVNRPEDASTVLRALMVFLQEEERAEKARDLEMTGDEQAARAALAYLAGRVQAAEVVPGRLVEGTGFAYYEPDVVRLRGLLGQDAASKVEVELQNGSGAVGVTEAVAQRQPLGYVLLAARNADQFPDVRSTQIFASPTALAEGQCVQRAIGLGRLVPREELPPGRIVVVVGKDLTVERLPPAVPAASTGHALSDSPVG